MNEKNDSSDGVSRDYSHFQIITARNSKWTSVRSLYIKDNPICKCCGKLKDLEVHHIIPVHIDARWELDQNNLITLCDRCHLVVGHLNDWIKFNKCITQDAAILWSRHDATNL